MSSDRYRDFWVTQTSPAASGAGSAPPPLQQPQQQQQPLSQQQQQPQYQRPYPPSGLPTFPQGAFATTALAYAADASAPPGASFPYPTSATIQHAEAAAPPFPPPPPPPFAPSGSPSSYRASGNAAPYPQGTTGSSGGAGAYYPTHQPQYQQQQHQQPQQQHVQQGFTQPHTRSYHAGPSSPGGAAPRVSDPVPAYPVSLPHPASGSSNANPHHHNNNNNSSSSFSGGDGSWRAAGTVAQRGHHDSQHFNRRRGDGGPRGMASGPRRQQQNPSFTSQPQQQSYAYQRRPSVGGGSGSSNSYTLQVGDVRYSDPSAQVFATDYAARGGGGAAPVGGVAVAGAGVGGGVAGGATHSNADGVLRGAVPAASASPTYTHAASQRHHLQQQQPSSLPHGAIPSGPPATTHAATAASASASIHTTAPLPLSHSAVPVRRGSATSASSGMESTSSQHQPQQQQHPSHSSANHPLSSSAGRHAEGRGGGNSSSAGHPPRTPPASQQSWSATAAAAAAAMGRSAAPSTTTMTTTTVAGGGTTAPPAAAAAAAHTNTNTAATRYTRVSGEDRPTVALSQNIMAVYQTINEIFYQERQKLLAAPAKYAARKYEDTSGHYIPCDGEVIADRYEFKELVGQGSFGKVLHCIDRKYNEAVAVKVIRSGPYFESQGWFEAQVVAHLNNEASLQNLVVQLRKVFLWKGHMVLVFEPLSFSLYKLITLTRHNGVSLDLTRKFAYQMVKVLLVLEQHQPPIIHCDLKPENVLLRDPSRSGVRVIDFGSACYQQQAAWRLPPAQVALPTSSPSASAGPPWDAAEGKQVNASTTTTTITAATHPSATAVASVRAGADGDGDTGRGTAAEVATAGPTAASERATREKDGAGSGRAAAGEQPGTEAAAQPSAGADVEVTMPKYIQSRYYRSPEVILELGYTTAIDRWSLGCFLAEMHTGRPLFQGNNEADMVAYFTMVRGPLPDYMIASSPKRTRLYHTCVADDEKADLPSSSAAATAPPPTTAAAAAAQALLRHQQQQKQKQQRAASPLLAFSTAPSPALTPFTEAPGHALGSPFFLRAPQVEEAESATAVAVRADGPGTPLEKVLGVYTGGPRGCRAGQPGHDEAAYAVFYDFLDRLLQFDPRKRMSCSEAILHPFLEPIRILEARAVAAASTSPSSTSPQPDGAAPGTSGGEGDGGAGSEAQKAGAGGDAGGGGKATK